MDHSTLKRIYCSKKLAKPVRIQKFLEQISDFSFYIEHISGKLMFVSDFFSRFSSNNTDKEPISYLTDTSNISGDSYMSYLDDMWDYNFDTQQAHSQKIKK